MAGEITINKWSLGQHAERNEDGVSLMHPGYAVKPCSICGRDFMLGVDAGFSFKALPSTCGRPGCEAKAGEVTK